MPTSTVNKETAMTLTEVKNQLAVKYGYADWPDMIGQTDDVQRYFDEAMREIASLTWDACAERKQQEWRYIVNPGNSREEITAPDKETYLTNLFEK